MAPLLLSLLLGAAPGPVEDFALRDAHGTLRRLSEWRERQLVVLVVLTADCPLARLYGPRLAELARTYEPRGVAFLGLAPNSHDTPAVLRRYANQHGITWPILRDVGGRVADRIGAERTPEVFVLDETRTVRYRGRIDDQYDTRTHRARPTRRELADALDALLAGRPVAVSQTTAPGCLINRAAAAPERPAVTYSRDVAPILQKHCVTCHRPGQVGPFPLTSYRHAASHAETIREVVEDGRMPPWGAGPAHGRFANEARLTSAEKQLLFDWIDNGCSEGNPAELPPPRVFPEGWSIPGPDLVLTMPEPFVVPAEGVVEYQFIEIDPGLREDRWVRALEVRPGNRAVLHHCTVFLKPPDAAGPVAQGSLGSYCLVAWVPGSEPTVYPEGMAKKLPAGWHVVFVLHYTPIGREQSDRTSLALSFADPKTVRREVATQIMQDENLCIPPRVSHYEVAQTWRVNEPVQLLSFFPHMHLRGKSFRYDVTYPDGTNEVLLSVPRYNFAWQQSYILAEPKRLPAGSLLRCTAIYDNSEDNPANPDPNAEVRSGRQTWDEMFNGYFDVVRANEGPARGPLLGPGRAALLVAGLGGVLLWRRRRGRTGTIHDS